MILAGSDAKDSLWQTHGGRGARRAFSPSWMRATETQRASPQQAALTGEMFGHLSYVSIAS
jgi:hypothetical protein